MADTISNISNWRRAEQLVEGKWQDIEFKDIKKGMTVRLFETNGEPVIYTDHATGSMLTHFVTADDAFPVSNMTDNYGFTIESVKDDIAEALNVPQEMIGKENSDG